MGLCLLGRWHQEWPPLPRFSRLVSFLCLWVWVGACFYLQAILSSSQDLLLAPVQAQGSLLANSREPL